MKNCPYCNSLMFKIESDDTVNYVSCSLCNKIVGTFKSNEDVKAMIQEHHSGMVIALDRIIQNQGVIIRNQSTVIENQSKLYDKIK